MDQVERDLTERKGLIAVEAIFLEFGWFFRDQPVLDWGIDAHVEVVEDGKPTGRLFALQIKTGPSYFKKKGDNFVFYGEKRHLEYWSNHSLPVYLILHNPESGLTLWNRVIAAECEVKGDKWSIVIPAANVLKADSKLFFEAGFSDDNDGSRRLRFWLDRETMTMIGDQPAFFVWQDWVNKSLGLRN